MARALVALPLIHQQICDGASGDTRLDRLRLASRVSWRIGFVDIRLLTKEMSHVRQSVSTPASHKICSQKSGLVLPTGGRASARAAAGSEISFIYHPAVRNRRYKPLTDNVAAVLFPEAGHAGIFVCWATASGKLGVLGALAVKYRANVTLQEKTMGPTHTVHFALPTDHAPTSTRP